MRVVAIHNEKGGIGKTTTTINLSAALAAKGKKILLVDMDTQANLSKSLLPEITTIDEMEFGIWDVAEGKKKFADVIETVTDKIDIIPASRSLQNIDHVMTFDFSKLKYDFVFIDCSPTLSYIVLSSLKSSNEVIIPTDCDKFAFDGVMHDVETAKSFGVKITGVLIVRYIERLVVSKVIVEDLKAEAKERGFKVFKTPIRANVAVIESHIIGKNIFDYDPKCAAAEDYRKFANEFLKGEK